MTALTEAIRRIARGGVEADVIAAAVGVPAWRVRRVLRSGGKPRKLRAPRCDSCGAFRCHWRFPALLTTTTPE